MAISRPSNCRMFRPAVTPIFFAYMVLSVVGCVCGTVYLILHGRGFHPLPQQFLKGIRFVFIQTLIISFVMAWLVALFYRVGLSPGGIYGHSFWGQRRFIGWLEIKAARTIQIGNLPCVRIYGDDGKVVWLLLFQSRTVEFREEIRRLAPPDSPILKCL